MSKWEWKKLKDICEKGSSNIKQSDLKDLTGDYPIFGASGYIQNVDFYQRDRDYIGIIKDGSGVGRTMLLPAFSSVIGTLQYILPKEGNDIKFINYALQNIDFSKSVQGAAIPHIYFKDYGETEILVPPLSEQNRIVKFLDEEFSKIDTLKTNAETNLKKAGAIFDAELKKEFNNKKWDSKKLNDLCELISGYAFDSKGYSSKNEDTLLVCGDNIMHCSFRWETVKRWPKEKCFELKRFELKDSDIVLAMDRPWIKSGLKISKITGNELPSLLVQRTAALRTTSHVSSDYLYYALQEKKFSDYLIDQQTGSGVPHISGKQILNFQIPLPPLSVQKEIVARLDKLTENVKRLETNYKQIIANCDELKKTILKQTFQGGN